MGEGIAWTVGWCLMLEYLFSASLVAISWAGYTQSTLHQFGIDLPAAWMSAPFDVKDAWHIYRTTTWVNLPAMLVTAACTLVLLGGLKTSARVNNVIVVAKVSAILVVVVVGAGHVHTALWHPYIPPNTGTFGVYGWSGVFQGTAILFFAYIGFDTVSTMGQEARNPQRTVPLSLLLGLGICAVLYLAVSFVVTGLVGYHDLDVPDPMYLALDRAGPSVLWAKSLVGFVAVVGLVSVLLVTLMGQIRIFYAMGRDGLLPAAFARVHPRTRTPHIGTIVTGAVSCVAAGILPLALLGDIISMGTLLAFGIVCGGVLVLRRTRPDLPRPFKAPGGVWVPLAGALCCVGLMATLPRLAWVGFLIWLVIGLAVYGSYGATRSKLQRIARP
jgi:basic amino acid/polyamine antiporter, APA family